MAKIRISIEPTKDTRKQLAYGTKLYGSALIGYLIFAKAQAIGDDIGNILTKALDNSPVIQALKGNSSVDLPAHLGLSDQKAFALVNGINDLILSGIRIIQKTKNDFPYVRVQAVPADWEKYLSIPGAVYISQPSGITIPVMRWLLLDPSIDIGQAAYDIVFRGTHGGKFDAQIKNVSRSGRAIMASLKSLGGSNGYVLPSIISGTSGENFIEHALSQPNVTEQIVQAITKRIS